MKKVVGIILLSFLVLLTGCTSLKEKQFVSSAREYAEKFNTFKNVDSYVVSLENLSKAKDAGYEFKTDKLSKCEKDSTVTFNYKDGKIIDYEVKLTCK